DAGHLGLRCAARHHRDRGNAQPVGGPGHALGVVAGRGGDHVAVVAALARGQQRVERAAHLVRTGALQVLELEPGAEAFGVVRRGDVQVPAQPRLRRQHVAGGHVDGAGYGRVHQTAVSQWRQAGSWPRTTRAYSACSSRVTGLSPYWRSSIWATGATSAAVPQANTSSASSRDRKSTRLNSSHVKISYAVFCLKK